MVIAVTKPVQSCPIFHLFPLCAITPFTDGVNTNAVALSESFCNEGDLCPPVRYSLLTSTPRAYLQVNHYSNSIAPLQGETSKISWCKTCWNAKCSASQWPKGKSGRTALIPGFQLHTLSLRDRLTFYPSCGSLSGWVLSVWTGTALNSLYLPAAPSHVQHSGVVKFRSVERQVCKMNYNWANNEFSDAYPHQNRSHGYSENHFSVNEWALCPISASAPQPFQLWSWSKQGQMISSFNERNVPFSFLFSGKQVSWFCSNVQDFNKDPLEGHPWRV